MQVPTNDLVLRHQEIVSGTEWNPCDNGFCFLLLKEGRLILHSDNQSRRLYKGDMVVFRKDNVSKLRVIEGQNALVYYIQFQPEALNGFLSMGESRFLELPSLLWRELASVHSAGSSLAQSFLGLVEAHAVPGTLAYSCRVLQLIAALVPSNIDFEDTTLNIETVSQSRIIFHHQPDLRHGV